MSSPFVILTSKPGQFRTEPGPGLVPVEAWDYFFCDRLRARFLVARLEAETRVEIVEETPPHGVNRIRSKFLPRFLSLQAARDEIGQLARSAGTHTRLQPAPP